MPGRYVSEIEFKLNIENLLKKIKETQDRMDDLEKKEYKIDLDIDTKKFDSAIQKLDKMLDSLGKGTGDFKQLENLSKELSTIASEVQSFSQAFGKVDDSGTKTLLSSIQDIGSSLSDLNKNILSVTQNMSNMSGNTNGAVKQMQNIGDAASESLKKVDKLAEAQSKIGNKTNVSVDTSGLKKQEQQINKNIDSLKKLTDLSHSIKNVDKSDYSKNNDWRGYYSSQEEAVKSDLSNKKNRLDSSLNLILSEDKNAVNALKSEIDGLESSLQSVQELSNRISSNSKLDKNMDYANQYKLIDDRLGELNNKYELTNSELEEYITLQIKAQKITDKMASESGGVKGSGARDKSELNLWIKRGFARDLGYNPDEIYNGLFGNITDALYDGKISLFNADGTKKNIREISAELLNYKSVISDLTGSFGVNEDFGRLNELKGVFSYIKENLNDIKSIDFTSQIKDQKSIIEALKSAGADSEVIDSAKKNLQDLLLLQERLNSVKNNISEDNSLSQQNKLQEELKETESQAEKTAQAVKEMSSTTPKKDLKDTFQGEKTGDLKSDPEVMEQLENSTKEAVEAKKEFAVANEGVQSSIDESKSPLQLEAELMTEIAKSAKEAAEAKKEFVEANRQVQNSTDQSDSKLKNNSQNEKYKNRNKISEDDFLVNSSKYASIANSRLTSSGNTILGNTVNTELIDGLVRVSAKIKDADGVWKTFSARIDADGNMFNQRFNTITKGINQLESDLKGFGKDNVKVDLTGEQTELFNKLNDAIERYATLKKRIATGKFLNSDEEEANKLLKTINQIMGKADGSATILSNTQLDQANKKLHDIEQTVSDIVKKTKNKQVDSYDKNVESYDKKAAKYQATAKRFEAGGWTSDAYTDNLTRLNNAIKGYKDTLASMKSHPDTVSDKEIENMQQYEATIKQCISAISNMSAAQKGFTLQSGQKALSKIDSLLKENSKMSKTAKAQIKAYYNEIKFGNPSASLDVILGKVQEIVNAEIAAGRGGKSMWDAIKEKAYYGFAGAIGTYFGFNDIIQYGKEAISIVTEFDTALTEMRKVSDESVTSLKNYQKTTFDTANTVGTTALQIQQSTADYMRLGESLDDAAESAKTANVLLNVSEFDNIEDATKSLVSMGQAYKDLDKMSIVDKLNEVGRFIARTYSNVWHINIYVVSW